MFQDFSKISAQGLNSLFSQFAQQPDKVFWISSFDFQRQLYVSPTFDDIWGRSREMQYACPSEWINYINKENLEKVKQHLMNRYIMQSNLQTYTSDSLKNTVLYEIYRPDGAIRRIKDYSFPLYINNTPVVFVGIAENVSESQWALLQDNKLSESLTPPNFSVDFAQLLSQEFNTHHAHKPKPPLDTRLIKIHIKNSLGIRLAKREIECIYYLCQGYSAKETAKQLFLSPRTVETYLENARRKLNCRSQAALVSILSQYLTTYIP